MRRIYFVALFCLVTLAAQADAKGRRPAESEQGFGWDDSRVKRGSPANPTSAYQPPQFESSLPPMREESQNKESTRREESPKAQKSKASDDEWTFQDNSTQNTPDGKPAGETNVPPTPSKPPTTTLESGEQALPEYPTEDPLEKQPKK